MAAQIVVAGAGLSGATIARVLAEAGLRVTVMEARGHAAGNCHTDLDPGTGVLVHRYGPHIFHTDDQKVIAFLGRFTRFVPYRHQVRTTAGGRVYAMPINLHTINQFFGRAFRPDEARAFIAGQADARIRDPQNFEEKALSLMGSALYEAFFKGYTEKQWGRPARLLPASVLTRLPFRFTYDDAYFSHAFQAMPEHGYTAMVEAMLDHEQIDLHLGSALGGGGGRGDHVVWSGPIDGFFGYRHGRLAYRTLDFEEFRADGDWQGTAVMNEADPEVPHTRTTEHRHFSPWRPVSGSVLYRERSRDCGPDDIPYYPVRLAQEQEMLALYEEEARRQEGVTFVGRLGTYRYLDMDQTVRQALDAAGLLLRRFGAARG